MDTGVTKQPFWSLTEPEILKILDSKESGLEDQEISLRTNLFGPNEITQKKRFFKLKSITSQIKNPFIVVLIIAGLISLVFRDLVEVFIIFGAVIINVVLGFWQENKAHNAIESLKTYIRTRVRIYRSGREFEIDARDLVPGDIIKVSQGDRVPADARILYANNLEIDEAVLTGESLPRSKKVLVLPAATALPERISMIFGGTMVVQGWTRAIVTATGFDTEFGKIAALIEKEKEDTPLQKSLAKFTIRTGTILIICVAILFGIGLYVGHNVFDLFFIAIAVAVSAVPEGLPIALTVILAIGVERIAKKGGVVSKLLAAETLGSTSLILTDKTGTLTQARMSLSSVTPIHSEGKDSEKELLKYALINSDVVIENPSDLPEKWRIIGSPLEAALVLGAARNGILLPALLKEINFIDKLPFNSSYKFSATAVRWGDRKFIIVVGAPEIVIKRTTLESKIKERVISDIHKMALGGGRIVGVALREVKDYIDGSLGRCDFGELDFIGFCSLRDPLRPGVAKSIRTMADAGVKTVIVSGDHAGTAESVAREIGLVDGKGAVLTGDDLNYLSQEELEARAGEVTVYARVTPEQKMKIVELYKKRGEVVAVTGDGINDAPALQAADVGVALGSGADVSKNAADLVILDDSFETIVVAIGEGRRILDNIRKVIVYLLSSALDELLLIGGALVSGVVLPINALQILFVNFFSDSFPAMALAFEKGIDELGTSPRKLDRNLFDWQMKFFILFVGILTSVLLFVVYFLMLRWGFPLKLVQTFTFASFASYSLFFVFSVRSLDKGILSYGLFSNLYLVFGVVIGFILVSSVLYVPFLQRVFDTVSLPPVWALGVFAFGLFNIIVVELGKWLFRKKII